MAYFDGLIETILAVGLVKPKQGVFLLNPAFLCEYCLLELTTYFFILRDFAATHSLPLSPGHICGCCDSWAELPQRPGW